MRMGLPDCAKDVQDRSAASSASMHDAIEQHLRMEDVMSALSGDERFLAK
jgi:hypothetical protein